MKEVAWLEGPESQGTMGLHFQLVLRCDGFFHWCFCVCDEALPKLVLCCIKYTFSVLTLVRGGYFVVVKGLITQDFNAISFMADHHIPQRSSQSPTENPRETVFGVLLILRYSSVYIKTHFRLKVISHLY